MYFFIFASCEPALTTSFLSCYNVSSTVYKIALSCIDIFFQSGVTLHRQAQSCVSIYLVNPLKFAGVITAALKKNVAEIFKRIVVIG